MTATTTTLSPSTTTATTGASGTTTSSSSSTTSPSCTSCATGGDCSQECTASCGSAGVSSFTCNKVGNIIQQACICNSASSSNPCFHEDTVIEYQGKRLSLKHLQDGAHRDCVVPHIVSSQGVVIEAKCGSSKKTLRLTSGHIVFTQRGLVAASELTKHDTLFSDLDQTLASECQVVSVNQEPKPERYFGLNCLQSEVLANGLKTSTFEKLHTLPSVWMRVVGRVFGIHSASALGDRIATAAHRVGLI